MKTIALLDIVNTRKKSCGDNPTEIEFLDHISEKLARLIALEEREKKLRAAVDEISKLV